MEERSIDMYSIDVTFHHADPTRAWAPGQLEVQLKCTSQDIVRDDHVPWSLGRQAYDRLRSERVVVPSVLVVLVVPGDMDDWLLQSANQLTMSGEAYWASLRGAPSIDTGSKTVHLPRSQVFGVQPLLDIMERIGQGGLP